MNENMIAILDYLCTSIELFIINVDNLISMFKQIEIDTSRSSTGIIENVKLILDINKK